MKRFRTIIYRQLNFFGYAVRKERSELLAIGGKIMWKRGQDRQRTTLYKQMKDFIGIKENNELLNRVRNRDEWRMTTHEASNAWDRHGT